MVSVAKENLFHEKTKTIMSIGGVILSVFLIFNILGVYNGIIYTMDSVVGNMGADLWITQEGTSGSLNSPSILSTEIGGQLESIDDIEEYTPLIRTAVNYKTEDKNVLLLLNGYDAGGDLGKPWKIVEGKSKPKSFEIIVDKVFAIKFGFKVGDNITLQSKEFEIVGISDETNLMVAYVAFLTFEDASSFLPVANITNIFLVKVKSSASVSEVKSEIEKQISDVDVKTCDEVAEAYKYEIIGNFIPVIYVLSGIALFVGTLVIGLLIYMLTLEKSKEYGIIKAIGATNLYLYKIVLIQALLISFIGYIIGSLVSIPLIILIQNAVPEFMIVLNWDIIFMGFFLFIITGVIASFIPIRRITAIDPALVFKG